MRLVERTTWARSICALQTDFRLPFDERSHSRFLHMSLEVLLL